MNRRAFLGASALACTGASLASADENPTNPEFYEIRAYTLEKKNLPTLDGYLEKALIPAAKRHGAGPVGVFLDESPEQTKLFVLIVHPDAECAVTFNQKCAADGVFLKAAGDYWQASAAAPVYDRINSSLLTAIAGMKRLNRPDPSRSRLFNLRIYESHNERAAAKKVEMFEKGELDIFQRVGLTPVFFASATIGSDIPNLTYMLVFEDDAARLAAWDKFRADPEWLKLKAIPEYADKEIVSKITNYVLKPRAYSEL